MGSEHLSSSLLVVQREDCGFCDEDSRGRFVGTTAQIAGNRASAGNEGLDMWF